MYSKLQLANKYVRYYLTAQNGKGHGIHSPFVFQLVTELLNDDRKFYAYESIEAIRKQLLHDHRILTIQDFGAGSRLIKTTERPLAAIAASSLKPKKYSQLLFRMVDYFKPTTILELGTSFGITTSYMACAMQGGKVITLEGSPAVAAVALENFKQQQLHNIQLINGDFDTTLPAIIAQANNIFDFIFIDGNHRYEPTIRYFEWLLPKMNENSIIIFDDIHWSKEMEQAWHHIKQHPSVTLTIDLFFIGIVFFRKENKQPEHFTIRF